MQTEDADFLHQKMIDAICSTLEVSKDKIYSVAFYPIASLLIVKIDSQQHFSYRFLRSGDDAKAFQCIDSIAYQPEEAKAKFTQLVGAVNLAEAKLQVVYQKKCLLMDEAEDIANNEVYLANMSKSFADKAWFLKMLPSGVDTIVDFGGGAGEFAEYCNAKTKDTIRYIVIDNNQTFLKSAQSKGIRCYDSLQALHEVEGKSLEKALLVLSSVIHEVYSYKDPFYDDVGVFWSDIKRCNFKAIAIRDMSISEKAFKNVPVDAILWVYENVFHSQIEFKGKTLNEITSSFEHEWGPICDVQLKKVNVKELFHFLIKYRYQENWAREVKENYLPVSQDKLQEWLTKFMSYKLVHKESSHLAFYDQCWTKDFKLNRPDSYGYKKVFQAWLSTLSTHIKWLASH